MPSRPLEDVGRVSETLAIGSWGRDVGHHDVLMGINALGSVAVMFGIPKHSMIPIVTPTALMNERFSVPCS